MEGLFKEDSYSQFMPLRQSSTLAEQILPKNGSEVNANISTVWQEGFLAREKAKQKELKEMKALNQGMCEKTLHSTLSNSSNATQQTTLTENYDETLRTDDLGCSFPQNNTTSISAHQESACGSFYTTALDLTLPQEHTDVKNNELTDQDNLNANISMEEEP